MILCVSVFVCVYMFEEMLWLIIFDTKAVGEGVKKKTEFIWDFVPNYG